MQTVLFNDHAIINVRALFIGERIDLKTLEGASCLDRLPLTIKVGQQGCGVLQRYGTVVLFNVEAMEEASFLNDLQTWTKKPFPQPEQEEARLLLDASAKTQVQEDGSIVLVEWSLERLQTVADILAKSVVLAHFEASIAQAFARIEPIAASIQHQSANRQPGQELLRHIGNTLLIQQTMVGLVGIEEKPELLWEHPELERLYLRLEDEYEIQERHRALERKLEIISNTASTLLELMQHRSGIRLEWYILGLIFVETMLTTYEIFFLKRGG